jgi:hypothetical protein
VADNINHWVLVSSKDCLNFNITRPRDMSNSALVTKKFTRFAKKEAKIRRFYFSSEKITKEVKIWITVYSADST